MSNHFNPEPGVAYFVAGLLTWAVGFTLGVGIIAAAIITPIKHWSNK